MVHTHTHTPLEEEEKSNEHKNMRLLCTKYTNNKKSTILGSAAEPCKTITVPKPNENNHKSTDKHFLKVTKVKLKKTNITKFIRKNFRKLPKTRSSAHSVEYFHITFWTFFFWSFFIFHFVSFSKTNC